jgi:addiction module RelE/StbE family toxin
MYTVLEHKKVGKALAAAPAQVKGNYLAWKRIVELEGPHGLRLIKGFHDESLKGEWRGFRSSRLSKQWRVIYSVEKECLTVYVVEVNPHTY